MKWIFKINLNKFKYIFLNKIYGSNFIKQHMETVIVWNYQNADCSFKKKFTVLFIIIFGTVSFLVFHYDWKVELVVLALTWRSRLSVWLWAPLTLLPVRCTDASHRILQIGKLPDTEVGSKLGAASRRHAERLTTQSRDAISTSIHHAAWRRKSPNLSSYRIAVFCIIAYHAYVRCTDFTGLYFRPLPPVFK